MTDQKDVAGTVEALQAQVAELKARQDAAEAVKNRPPAAPGRRSAFSSRMAERQEQARLARVRAAELADVEAAAAARRDQPRRAKIEKRLEPIEARLAEITATRQALDVEERELGRRRWELQRELNPPRETPVALIVGPDRDPVRTWNAQHPKRRSLRGAA